MSTLDISLDGMDREKSNVDIVSPNTKIVDVTDVTTGGQSGDVTPLGNNQTPPDKDIPPIDNPAGEVTDPITNTNEPIVTTEQTISSFLSGEGLSDEETEDRTKLFEIYGARGYDINRNLLDKDGKVVLFYSDLEKFIDKGTLPVNDKGQLLYANGDIIESASLVSFVDDTNVFLQNEYGFGIPNLEEINAIEDETERRNVMYKSIVSTAYNNGINNFLANNPIINDFHNHLKLGGTPDTFKGSGIDYSKVELENLGVSDKVGLIKEMYKLKGINIDANFLKFVEQNEEALNASATDAIKELDTFYKDKSKNNAKILKEQQQAEKEATDNYWNGINDVIKKGELANSTNIPDKDKESFFRYLANPVKDGLSQNMIDSDKVTIEEELLLAYIRFKGKSIGDFIKSKVNTDVASKRRSTLQNYKPVIQSEGNLPTKGVNIKGISLDNMQR